MCAKNQLAAEGYKMMLVGGYFDESSDEFAEVVYTVAGYMAPGHQASIFELRWASLLQKWKMAYFKASELEYGFGEFAQYRDDPTDLKLALSQREKDLIREIKTDFVDLICKEPDLWGFSATINLRDYALLRLNEPELAARIPKPYYLCSQLVLMETGFQLSDSNHASPAWAQANMRPIFDSHDDYESTMKSSFEEFCRANPVGSRYMLPPFYEKEQTYLCLQAADCLAFESRKFADQFQRAPDREPRIAFTRLMQHVRTAFYLNYDALKFIASEQPEPDTLPIQPTIRNHPTALSR